MRDRTSAEAAKIFCHLTMASPLGSSTCLGERCMAWVVTGRRHRLDCRTVTTLRDFGVTHRAICNCSMEEEGGCSLLLRQQRT